jgi:hypothetical protein
MHQSIEFLPTATKESLSGLRCRNTIGLAVSVVVSKVTKAKEATGEAYMSELLDGNQASFIRDWFSSMLTTWFRSIPALSPPSYSLSEPKQRCHPMQYWPPDSLSEEGRYSIVEPPGNVPRHAHRLRCRHIYRKRTLLYVNWL